ncbi:MAG TPA: class I SAM-dependent methyltransferase, partial [Vicinamibacteria bacterium]|nr:class I SAM-dependent methyltransferase [Vicinamibacteria bacterium]
MVQTAAPGDGPRPLSDPILEKVRAFYEDHHDSIARARHSHRYFYDSLIRAVQARVPEGERVLDIGCGSGHLLAALRPSWGVGIDISTRAVAAARKAHPGEHLHFIEGDGSAKEVLAQVGGPFDVIVMINVVTHLKDVQAAFEALHAVCHPRTRLLVYSYSRLWQPLLRLGEIMGFKHRPPPDAWLPPEEIRNMMTLADFEVVRGDYQVICPARIPLLADFLNGWVGHLPAIEWMSLMYGIVARPAWYRFAGHRS